MTSGDCNLTLTTKTVLYLLGKSLPSEDEMREVVYVTTYVVPHSVGSGYRVFKSLWIT